MASLLYFMQQGLVKHCLRGQDTKVTIKIIQKN
uniref:Uncharacterized protein n=1 Tax=Arundo donax TaxID=35708 RepID=A0A0A9HM58_ARUDO